jgi:hypothetical protein
MKSVDYSRKINGTQASKVKLSKKESQAQSDVVRLGSSINEKDKI